MDEQSRISSHIEIERDKPLSDLRHLKMYPNDTYSKLHQLMSNSRVKKGSENSLEIRSKKD
jgi:hypothetical protein